jgi:hypothetical protein
MSTPSVLRSSSLRTSAVGWLTRSSAARSVATGMPTHGIIQADNPRMALFRPFQIASAQTIGACGLTDDFDVVVVDTSGMFDDHALAALDRSDSIILVDFMEQAVAAGRPLFDAILESRVVRLRPILLTAGAAMLSAIPVTLDPIFSGLGWSLIFGLIASTIFTLFVIPVTYWLFYAGRTDGIKR